MRLNRAQIRGEAVQVALGERRVGRWQLLRLELDKQAAERTLQEHRQRFTSRPKRHQAHRPPGARHQHGEVYPRAILILRLDRLPRAHQDATGDPLDLAHGVADAKHDIGLGRGERRGNADTGEHPIAALHQAHQRRLGKG